MSARTRFAIDAAEQLDAAERGRFANAALHGVPLGPVAGDPAGARRADARRAPRRRPAARGCPCAPRGWRGTGRSGLPAPAGAGCQSLVVDAVRQLVHAAPAERRGASCETAAGVERSSGAARRCCARRIDALDAQREPDRRVASAPGPDGAQSGDVGPEHERRLVARQREAHAHVDRVQLVDEVEAPLAGQTRRRARRSAHMKRSAGPPWQAVQMHIWRQLALEGDRPRRHVQLVPPPRELADEAVRRPGRLRAGGGL